MPPLETNNTNSFFVISDLSSESASTSNTNELHQSGSQTTSRDQEIAVQDCALIVFGLLCCDGLYQDCK